MTCTTVACGFLIFVIEHDINTQEKRTTVAVQGMNIEILPPEIKYLGQLITFKNAVQVESSSTTASVACEQHSRATDRS